jgi:hypothetical protein
MADLVTLASVKRYLVIPTSNSDGLIAELIARESRLVEQWTSRRFPAVTNTAKRLNGTGGCMLVLPDSPIIGIDLLQIGATVIPASSDGLQTGYTFDDTTIYLTGGARFPQGRQNVLCSWTAGYQEAETGFIPTDNPATLAPSTGGAAAQNVSVKNAATGAALVEVGSNPATGQYSFADGIYTFAAADFGVRVTMTYYYVPGPVAMACIEMVGLDLKQRDNLGVTSKTLGGETITYTDKGMSSSVKEMLQPYRRITPA